MIELLKNNHFFLERDNSAVKIDLQEKK